MVNTCICFELIIVKKKEAEKYVFLLLTEPLVRYYTPTTYILVSVSVSVPQPQVVEHREEL